jgi:pimeloyl-ACP methyl ester carboxylesterase
MTIRHTRAGSGKPLLLVHGLGGTRRSWDTISPALAQAREVIALDLPGHGQTPEEADSGKFEGLARSLDNWLLAEGLVGIDMVGSSMGARLVLEMARRGQAGAVVALDPGGFWRGWERTFFKTTIAASIRLVRALRPTLPAISQFAAGRTALMAQLSARPWALDPRLISQELESFADTRTFDALVNDLATGPEQQGSSDTRAPVVIGWGRKDRLCLPRQASRASAAFPKARVHWFQSSGHFPMWDEPQETIRVILDAIHHRLRPDQCDSAWAATKTDTAHT